jgi:rhodanese-related sulfurtransferase
MGKLKSILIVSSLIGLLSIMFNVMALEVMITPKIGEFSVKHGKKALMIRRNQDTDALLEFDFARTSRPCPPFCAQPIEVADGVKTVGEVELITFMKRELKDGNGLLIDARTPDWHERGTIPGSINVPYTHLNLDQGADEITLEESLKLFGAKIDEGAWDFTQAKRLVLWCNGPWCGQSPAAIRGLLKVGYPRDKLYYYRGGMQLWQVFGLPVVTPRGELLDQ